MSTKNVTPITPEAKRPSKLADAFGIAIERDSHPLADEIVGQNYGKRLFEAIDAGINDELDGVKVLAEELQAHADFVVALFSQCAGAPVHHFEKTQLLYLLEASGLQMKGIAGRLRIMAARNMAYDHARAEAISRIVDIVAAEHEAASADSARAEEAPISTPKSSRKQVRRAAA